jgi:hypothetical protein
MDGNNRSSTGQKYHQEELRMFPAAHFLWLLVAFSTSDGTDVLNHNQQASSTKAIPPDLLITLERTGCEGACPMYTLKISAGGVVVYQGKQFVRNKRRAVSRLTQKQLRELLSEFERADYFSLRDRYQVAEDGCATSGLDSPSAITSLRINGRVKIIAHDYGCREKAPDGDSVLYPSKLFALEQRIDGIVEPVVGRNNGQLSLKPQEV